MTTYGKCVLTGLLLVGGYAALVWAFGMMNRPSNVSLYSGIGVVLGLLAAMPAVLRSIWRRRI